MSKSIALCLASLSLCSLVSVASADDPPPPRCVIVKAAGQDTSVEVHFKPSKMFAETNCRIDSRKAAEKWVAEHHACAAGAAAFDYTITFGDKKIELHGFCK